jgi:hypothetical protein
MMQTISDSNSGVRKNSRNIYALLISVLGILG